MAEVYFLGLDVGTTGCKAVVFDRMGRQMGRGYREYHVVCGEPFQAEQDPELVCCLLKESIKEAVKEAGISRIEALSLSVQGDAVIPVDRQFRVLHPAVLGMDYRSLKQCRAFEEKYDEWKLYEETGQPLHPINMMAKIMYFMDEKPEVSEKTWKFVTYEEFILERLGGEPMIDGSMASRSMGFSLEKKTWSEDILKKMGIPGEKLSRVCNSGMPVGQMEKKTAEQMGISNRPLLIAGGHDQPVGAVGAGIVEEGAGLDSTGTAEVLSVAYRTPAVNKSMHDSFYACYYHVIPEMYFSFAHMQTGGILQQWYRDQFGSLELAEAGKRGLDYYTYAQSKCPPGPSAVLVLPHFNGSGTPLCDMESKGAIVGLTLATTRHEILKGIIDGLCYELKFNKETMESAGVPIRRIRAVGGGARSPLWLQTKADIMEMPVETLACKEAGCLGAAILAAAGAGIYADIPAAIKEMVKTDRIYEPRKLYRERYREQYIRYRKLYESLCPVFHT